MADSIYAARLPRYEETFPALTAPEIDRLRRYGSIRKYSDGAKIPSLMLVAPPALNALMSSAIELLSLVNGARISASVANVKSATSSSGFSAARAVLRRRYCVKERC